MDFWTVTICKGFEEVSRSIYCGDISGLRRMCLDASWGHTVYMEPSLTNPSRYHETYEDGETVCSEKFERDVAFAGR